MSWVTLRFRVGRVLVLAMHTAIPLRTSIGFASFILAGRFMAMGTLYHNPILAHPFSHSQIFLFCLLFRWIKYCEIIFYIYSFYRKIIVFNKFQQGREIIFPNFAVMR